jgi:protease I
MRALIISADRFEDSELLVPCQKLKEEEIDTDIASPGKGSIRGKHGHKIKVDLSVDEVDPSRYDLLILPGGKAPAALRHDKKVLSIVRHFFERGKTVAAICHGPQILVSAGVLEGRRATCYRSVAEELQKAGANYKDAQVVVDGNMVTSRQPSDLPAFMKEIMKVIERSMSLK